MSLSSGLATASMADASAHAAAPDEAPVTIVAPSSEPSMVDATVTLGWANRYFAGGKLHGDEGILLQPGAELGLTLEDALSLRLFGAVWASIHQSPEDAAGVTHRSMWHEVDASAGISIDPADHLTTSLRFNANASPSRSFEAIHEIAVNVSLDDAELWHGALGHRFGGLAPSLQVAFDTDHTHLASGEGIGAELAFEPSFAIVRDGDVTVGLSAPVCVGLAMAGGPAVEFARGGLSLDLGLGFVPESAGEWHAKLNTTVLALGAGAAEENGGTRVAALASLGLEAGF